MREWRVTERFVKMPHTFTHEEYADMVYVYGYSNVSANAAVDEYRRRHPLRRTPNRAVFTNVFCALVLIVAGFALHIPMPTVQHAKYAVSRNVIGHGKHPVRNLASDISAQFNRTTWSI
jgi:hypothetical protein